MKEAMALKQAEVSYCNYYPKIAIHINNSAQKRVTFFIALNRNRAWRPTLISVNISQDGENHENLEFTLPAA